MLLLAVGSSFTNGKHGRFYQVTLYTIFFMFMNITPEQLEEEEEEIVLEEAFHRLTGLLISRIICIISGSSSIISSSSTASIIIYRSTRISSPSKTRSLSSKTRIKTRSTTTSSITTSSYNIIPSIIIGTSIDTGHGVLD